MEKHPVSSIALTSAAEVECEITGVQAHRLSFPEVMFLLYIALLIFLLWYVVLTNVTSVQGVENVVAEVTKYLNDAVTRYQAEVRRARDLDEEKTLLVQEVTTVEDRARDAEARVRDLARREAAAVAAAEAAKAELEAFKARAAAQQGEVLRAFADRIFRSARFSALANDLAGVVNTAAVAGALSEVAEDYPDLDIAKYGYEVPSGDRVLREYTETLLEYSSAFPVVEELFSSTTLLSTADVRACSVDRDPTVEDMIISLGQ